jgi:hypothetical protein
MPSPRATPALALLAACGAAYLGLAGCAATRTGPQPVATVPGTGSASRPAADLARTTGPAGDCPAMTAERSMVAVDYVDFVRWGGRQYLGTTAFESWGLSRISESDLGPVVFTVRCSYTALNDLTHAMPPEPSDGDASYLAAGTPVFAVRGWPTSCRLAAHSAWGNGITLYAALDPSAPVATPASFCR